MRKKQQRIEGLSIPACGGSLCTWRMGVLMTAYDEDFGLPSPLVHDERIEFRRDKHATPISTIRDLVEVLDRYSCSLVGEAAHDPEGYARILSYLVFSEASWRVIGYPSIEQDLLEDNFELRTEEHVPRVVDHELRFAVWHIPPPLGPDGKPLRPAPGSFGLRRIDPTTWLVWTATIDLVTGEVTRNEIPKRTRS